MDYGAGEGLYKGAGYFGLKNGQYNCFRPFDFCFKALWLKGPKGAPNDPK